MTEVTFADPTTTMDANTQKVLSILPPIQEKTPEVTPPPVISRPIDDHAKPHTLPPIQEQIRETSRPYTPTQIYDDRPSGASIGSANNLRTSVSLTNGQAYAQDEAEAALAFAAGIAITGFYDGITKSFSDDEVDKFAGDPDMGAPYYFGNKAGNAIRDIFDNPPHFDIPQPKIPIPDLSKIPEFKFPELPEFDIPGFRFPEPKDSDRPIPEPKIENPRPTPIPKSLERQLRELDLSPCGSISFKISYTSKAIGEYFNPDTRFFEEITVPSSLDEMYGLFSGWYERNIGDNSLPTLKEWIESNGGSGLIDDVNLGSGNTYKRYVGIGNTIYSDGNPSGSGYPKYHASQANILITGSTSKSSVNYLLDSLSFGGKTPEIYDLYVSAPTADKCPLAPQPQLQPDPPPPPPKKKDDQDEDMNCPAIDYRKIKAIVDDAIKNLDLVAAIPQSWQIRNEGSKPQLVIQCAEENGVDEKGNKKYKSAMYPISVPHWDGTASDKISLPSYVKGNYEGIYTLNDNSKVTINAQNEIECKRILNAIKPHIPKQYTKDAYFKGGVIVRDKPIKESRVKPRYGRYFKDGQRNNKPDWRVDFT